MNVIMIFQLLNVDLFEILKEYDAYREQLEKQHFYESNGIDIEVVMANT